MEYSKTAGIRENEPIGGQKVTSTKTSQRRSTSAYPSGGYRQLLGRNFLFVPPSVVLTISVTPHTSCDINRPRRTDTIYGNHAKNVEGSCVTDHTYQNARRRGARFFVRWARKWRGNAKLSKKRKLPGQVRPQHTTCRGQFLHFASSKEMATLRNIRRRLYKPSVIRRYEIQAYRIRSQH